MTTTIEDDITVASEETTRLPSERREPVTTHKQPDTPVEPPPGHLAPRVAPWQSDPEPEEDESPARGLDAVQHQKGTQGRRNPSFPDINITATAANLGITKSHLAKVLSGENKPSIDLAIALSRTLGLKLEEVVNLYKYRKA